MLVAPYATETVVGHAGSQRAAAFRVLAFRFLGMDRRGSGFRISLRGGFFNAVAGSPRSQGRRRLNRARRCKKRRARVSREIIRDFECLHDE